MIKLIKKCFAEEQVNLGRQRELDVAKGIAIIFMVFAHAFETLAWFFDPEASMELSYGIFDQFLGGSFAAPLFMFCMGISFCYSRKNSASDMFRRAWVMVGIATLLEVARTAIPGLLEWLSFGDPECIEYVYLFFNADILQFAALAMFVIALFKKLKLKPICMLGIAALFSVVGQLLQWVSTGSDVGDIVAGFIWRSYDYSYFPLLNWLIFPVCGYVLGSAWQRLQDKDAFFRIVTPISWAITAVYFGSMAIVGEWYYFSGGDYYGLGTGDALFSLAVCFAMIGLAYYLDKWCGSIARWLGSMGNRVTSIYCIHYTLYAFLYLLLLFFLEDYIPQWWIVPVSMLMVAASDLLSRFYKKIKTKKQ